MDSPEDLKAIIEKVATPEKQPLGPGDAQPTTETKNNAGLVALPFTPEDMTAWFREIELSDARIANRAVEWDILLNEYLPVVKATGVAEALKVNVHFRNVHTKLPQLFYRSPDLFLSVDDPSPAQNSMPNPMQAFAPIDPLTGLPQQLPPLTMEDIISIKQAVLNKKLGRDGLKAHRLMDELLFDVLAWTGLGCYKLGYRCVMAPIQEPVTQMVQPPPQPAMPGAILNLQPPAPPQPQPVMDPATGQPQMRTVKVPIYEEWYARRFSTKKLITNADLKSSRIDEDATLMGMHFYISQKRAMREFGLTEDEAKAAATDDKVFKHKPDEASGGGGLVHCMELWVKASYYTDEPHPQALNQIVLVEGLKNRPVVWRPSPDQTFDDRHRLTKDSLLGFPIGALTIRDIADSLFPPSDSAFTNSQAKELNTYRRQGVQMRDAAIGKYLADISLVDEEDKEKIKEGAAGEIIFVKPGALEKGSQSIFAPTAQAHRSGDDYQGQNILKQDMNETLGIGSNAAGDVETTVRTATESNNVQQGMVARNEKERGRTVEEYLMIARKIDQLLMRYADTDQYIEITGIDGAKKIQMWNSQIVSGKFLYDIAPDSQLVPDSAREFKQTLDMHNVFINDPLYNRAYVMRRMARMRGLDPSKVILNPLQQMTQAPMGGGGGPANQHQLDNSGKPPNAPGADNHRAGQPKP